MTSRKLSGRVPSDTAGPLKGVWPARKQQGILGVVIFLHSIVVICSIDPHTIAAQGKQGATPAPMQVTTQGLLGLDRNCKVRED
jgi:hypothetical protein